MFIHHMVIRAKDDLAVDRHLRMCFLFVDAEDSKISVLLVEGFR